MAPRVFQAFFLNVIFCLVAAQSIKYGLKGQEVKLKPQIQEQQPDLILWMHDDNKVVEFNGKEEDVYGPFKNRTTLDWHSAELHLTDLRSEDSGLYELELYMQKKSYFYYYTLQVIDKVAKPTITCETNSSKSSNLSGLLTCSAPQPDIEYEWFFYGNTQPGPQLRIFLDNKHDERVYSCRVSNPLSNETAEFTAKDCYSGRDNQTEDKMQKGFDENAELVTAVMEQVVMEQYRLLSQYEPDPAEKEASDLESSTEQTASEKENKEQFIHSAGEDREVGSAQVIKEPDTSSTEADQSVDNSSGEADKSVDKSSGEADKSVDNSSGDADTSDIQINLTSFHTGAVS
ncbi:uncharacterized protein LOC130521174 isoform X2 [Takifugu flavidus]|uniref:uncharacterized protein LOC130521174 isoform X2 n=1 Tax=Takifugu flavidus TaxID=433684 RepID=UPI002544CEB9|nr:uncharacterized protein LOC130521174 isoform X2 [Takifugu flavidus]